MKYVYAFRRSAYYPFNRQGWRNLPSGNALNSFLQKVSGMGLMELSWDWTIFRMISVKPRTKHQNFKNY